MIKKSKRSYIYISVVLILALLIVVFITINRANGIVDKTYCSDICPDESEWIAFQVYESNVSSEECVKNNDKPNYAYGWSNEYLGCTPEGYITLEEASEEMWANQVRK